ncbi:hypothetical protein REPUB_Repub16aG0001300 [Reevesia pubescens]
MEEYLQYMKTLRSQINDVEDQAANISAEEQIHFTTIQTFQNDLLSDTGAYSTGKKQLIFQSNRKEYLVLCNYGFEEAVLTGYPISYVAPDIGFMLNLVNCFTYYTKVAEDLSTKLQQQQDWVTSHKVSRQIEEHGLVNNKLDEQMTESEGNFSIENHPIMANVNTEAGNDLIVKLDLAKAKLDGIAQMKAKLVTDNGKIKESIEQAKSRANHFKPDLLEMSIMTLEEEYKALLSDKDGETEYLCTLQDQVEQIKGISHVITCACGEEFRLNLCA